MRKQLISSVILTVAGLVGFWYFYLRHYRENRLRAEAAVIIRRIEDYHQRHHRLPADLPAVGIAVIDEANPPLYYDRRDSTHYTVSYSTGIDGGCIYYSDSKAWERSYREMR
jgi:hypothetical protein